MDLYTHLKGLNRPSSQVPLPPVGALVIVVVEPDIKIRLQLFEGGKEPPSEDHPEVLVRYGPVEPLDEPVVLGVATRVLLCFIPYNSRSIS